MRKIIVSHISHGVTETGGYRHEQSLLHAICRDLTDRNYNVESVVKRASRVFKGVAHLKLLWFGFKHSTSDINIVVGRIALSAIIRNFFAKRKVVIALHHFDEKEIRTISFKLYYKLLFLILRYIPNENILIVAVADFWVDYFKSRVANNIPVVLYPNLFDVEMYLTFRKTTKSKCIFLGQYSSKNDQRIFDIAKQLSQNGFKCLFSTLNDKDTGVFEHYEIIHYNSHQDFLEMMSRAQYTLAFVKTNEGWNRVAHESILVGTLVIGTPAGGLRDLLLQANQFVVEAPEQVLEIVLGQYDKKVNSSFIERYDSRKSVHYVNTITNFCLDGVC